MSSLFSRALLGTCLAAVLSGATAAAPAPAVASEQARAMDVLRAFDKLCNAPKLDFAVLAERAKITGMKPVPATAAAGARVGRWGGTLPGGEFALLVDESRSIKGVLTSCAVAAEVGDADVFRAAAIKTMALRAGVKPDIGTDGGRLFDFGIVRPPSTRITIRDFKPKGLNRVLVSVSTLAPVNQK
jgi:hypothetical protein